MDLIISADYYKEISDHLEQNAINHLKQYNRPYKIVRVPGIFELPIVLSFFANKKLNSGYVLLGCVIQGETDHYHHITQEAFRSIHDIAIQHHLAIGTGIVTTMNYEQALVRSSTRNVQNNSAIKAVKSMMHLMDIFKHGK